MGFFRAVGIGYLGELPVMGKWFESTTRKSVPSLECCRIDFRRDERISYLVVESP